MLFVNVFSVYNFTYYILERRVEVVFSVKCQDGLISLCHCGVLKSLELSSMSGHFTR